jgi:hypothetical protein
MRTELTINRQFEKQILAMSKSEIADQANLMIENFDESLNDPIKKLALISKFQLLFDTLEKGLKEKSIEDLHKLGGKTSNFGVDFQISEVGVKYDYSENEKWVEINNQIKFLEEKRKEVEAFIKGIKSSFTQVDEETGEAIHWHPASKSSTTTIKRTIK